MLKKSLLLLCLFIVIVLNFSTVQGTDIPSIGESGCVPVHPTTGAPCPECCESQDDGSQDDGSQDDEFQDDLVDSEGCTPPVYTEECKECKARYKRDVRWYEAECHHECFDVGADPVSYQQYLDYEKCLEGSTSEPEPIPEPIPEPKPVLISEPIVEPEPTEEIKVPAIPLIQIGAVAAVTGEVTVIHANGSTEKLSSGKSIYHDDKIIIGSGKMQVMLLDETVFSMGSNTDLVLDEFVYDPNDKSIGDIAVSMSKGVFRFVTGKVARKKPTLMKIKLPGGWIGIRGTDFVVSHEESISSLHLHEGEVAINTETEVKILSAGKSVTFDETGIISEEDLTEARWKTLIKELEIKEKFDYVSFSIPIFMLIAIIGFIVYFIVRKKIVGEKTSRSSLILGLFSLLLGWMPLIGWILIILTFIFGFKALKTSGKKLAIMGLVMGLMSLILSVFVFISYF
ncbi:FecR domain-containing protein [Nanoarchaeota archaeon]